jgi:hypothetical protein
LTIVHTPATCGILERFKSGVWMVLPALTQKWQLVVSNGPAYRASRCIGSASSTEMENNHDDMFDQTYIRCKTVGVNFKAFSIGKTRHSTAANSFARIS